MGGGVSRGAALWRRFGAIDAPAAIGFGLRRAFNGFRLRAPERLFLVPQEIATSDPSQAADIYSGHFTLAGRTVLTRGESPFAVTPPSAFWENELNAFEWLRHFRTVENPVLAQHARALVADWLKARGAAPGKAGARPAVTARRTIAFLVNARPLLSGADHAFYRDFLRALALDALRLEAFAMRDSIGPARLLAAAAYATYTLCALDSDRDWRNASRLLGEALAAAILPDGAPRSRSPADAIEAASLLLPLRNTYQARGRTPPPELQPSIDRLLQFLRLLRHPGGQIALFNGMGATRLDVIGALLTFDDSLGLPMHGAPYGGYARMDSAGATLIADVGAPPPAAWSLAAGAGALAFEFSVGRERLVVNCGASPGGLDDLREALRETAAHSTLAMDSAGALTFRAGRDFEGAARRRLSAGCAAPAMSRSVSPAGETLELSQTAFLRSHGLIHSRTLTLQPDGLALSGHDRLAKGARRGKAKGGGALRFHLHPMARAAPGEDRRSVHILLPEGGAWTFETEAPAALLEESIFFGGLEMQRRSQQIVVPLPPGETQARWRFAASGATGPAKG